MPPTTLVDATFQERLFAAQDLPVLPQIHLQAMRVAADPNSNAGQLQDIIRHDASLASKILKVANSAYYGFRNRIDNLQTAVVMLGVDELMRLIATSSVLSSFNGENPSTEFEPQLYWTHSAAVGNVAGAMARKLKIPNAGDVYTGGLLHDIGKILLGSRFHLEYDVCLKYSIQHDVHIRFAESHILGLDHTQIGAHLAKNWGLPEQLVSIIRKHHTPHLERVYPIPVAIVHLANRICKRFGAGFADNADEKPLEKDPSWETVQAQIWPREINIDRTIENLIKEVRKSEDFISTLMKS
jgi:putative nucleotidyltransferase with HDIG domain